MRKLRFTIGGLMAVVLVLAIGFAALENPNPIWAGVFWALTHGASGSRSSPFSFAKELSGCGGLASLCSREAT